VLRRFTVRWPAPKRLGNRRVGRERYPSQQWHRRPCPLDDFTSLQFLSAFLARSVRQFAHIYYSFRFRMASKRRGLRLHRMRLASVMRFAKNKGIPIEDGSHEIRIRRIVPGDIEALAQVLLSIAPAALPGA